jgi:hypothetical protein
VAVIARVRPAGLDHHGGVGVTELVGHRRRRANGPAVVMTLGSRSRLGDRSHQQGRTEKGEDCLSYRKSPIETPCCEEGCPAWRRLDPYITLLLPDYYVANHHETASKFVGQKIFRLNIHQLNRQLDGLPLAYPVQCRRRSACRPRETHEEAGICNYTDLLTGVGADQIAAQERERARRSLCADRPDGRRQAGVLAEVRQFAGAATAAGCPGGSAAGRRNRSTSGRPDRATGRRGSAGGAGSAVNRVVRFLL